MKDDTNKLLSILWGGTLLQIVTCSSDNKKERFWLSLMISTRMTAVLNFSPAYLTPQSVNRYFTVKIYLTIAAVISFNNTPTEITKEISGLLHTTVETTATDFKDFNAQYDIIKDCYGQLSPRGNLALTTQLQDNSVPRHIGPRTSQPQWK